MAVTQSRRAAPAHRSTTRHRRRWVTPLILLVLIGGGVLIVRAQLAHRPVAKLPLQKNLRLVFSSNFSGSTLNHAIWDTCYPWADEAVGCKNYGSPEYEWYLPSQVHVSHGLLELVAQQLPTKGRSASGTPETYSCRSGMVTTYPGFRFKYGYLQVVARLPSTEGLWSALWMAASNLKWPPEIDLIEYWGRKTNSIGVYFHPLGGPRIAAYPRLSNLSSGWHTFAVDWTPTQVTWFINGQQVLSTRQYVPHQSMYFLADLAYTSTNKSLIETGSGCHGTLLVKSVKVWQPR